MFWDWTVSEYVTPHRNFNARLGRWTSPDPFWGVHNMADNTASILQAANLFLFTMNNPVRWLDPLGLFAIPADFGHFKDDNPIVYEALNDLLYAWNALYRFYDDPYTPSDIRAMIPQMRQDIYNLANEMVSIGNRMTISVGWWISPIDGRLNATQITLLMSNPSAGRSMMSATGMAEVRFRGQADGTMANARKHAYWTALGVIRTGDVQFVRFFTDAHEFGTRHNFSEQYMFRHMAVDIHNNMIGFSIASDALDRGFWARQASSHHNYIQRRTSNRNFNERTAWTMDRFR